MTKHLDSYRELIKNSFGKELNSVVPIFLSGADFCSAVIGLRNAAFYGRWFYSHPPHDVDVPGTLLANNPILVFSLLGKTVAAIRLVEYNYHASPPIDILFDEVFLAGENLDAVSINAVAGALTYLADVPPGGAVVPGGGGLFEKNISVYNDLADSKVIVSWAGGYFILNSLAVNLQRWQFTKVFNIRLFPTDSPQIFKIIIHGPAGANYIVGYFNQGADITITTPMITWGGFDEVEIRVSKSPTSPGGLNTWRNPDGTVFV